MKILAIQVQRVCECKDGWRMRFGRADLVTTVVVTKQPQLRLALELGAQIAEQRIAVMLAFNKAGTRK